MTPANKKSGASYPRSSTDLIVLSSPSYNGYYTYLRHEFQFAG